MRYKSNDTTYSDGSRKKQGGGPHSPFFEIFKDLSFQNCIRDSVGSTQENQQVITEIAITEGEKVRKPETD